MRIRSSLGIAGLIVSGTGCQNPMAPQVTDDERPAVFPPGVNLQTGPANRCRGAITSEIASDWPWPNTREVLPPPPGAVALFIETFGPLIGISSVRELQDLVCTD